MFFAQPADAYLATYNCGGYSYGTYVPGSNTIAYFSERGMSSCSTPNGLNPPDNCVARFVTPTAVAAAQSFFNCSSVPGKEGGVFAVVRVCTREIFVICDLIVVKPLHTNPTRY